MKRVLITSIFLLISIGNLTLGALSVAAKQPLRAPEVQARLVVVRQSTAPTSPPTPTPTKQPAPPDEVPTPISSDADELVAALDQPFALRVDQTAHLEDADFSLTFRSISDDSGCLTAADCSIMTADGSLVLRRGEESLLLSFSASFDPETPFSTEFAGLIVQMTSIKQLTDGSHVATFVITQPSAAPENGGIAAEIIERCPYFSRFDATALLQEDLQPSAIANLRFYPEPTETEELHGLCGYVGAENIPYPASDAPVIHLLTAVESERGGVAAQLHGVEIIELIPFVLNVLQENPQSRDSDVMLLMTQLMAGDYDTLIPFLQENADQSESITSEPISSISDEGLWLWQEIPGGYFSLLLIRTGDEFGLVAALLGDQVEELTVLDYSVIIARRMVEQAAVDEPLTTDEPPTDEPTPHCDLLAADAAAILNEAVHEQVVETSSMGCGYVAASDISPTDEEFSVSDARRGVFLQHLAGEELTSTLEEMAETVLEKVARPNPTAQNLFQLAIQAGNVQQAIQLLPKLTTGPTLWKVERVADLGEAAAFLWGRVDDRRVAALITVNTTGEAQLLVASLANDAQRVAVRDAMITAMTTTE